MSHAGGGAVIWFGNCKSKNVATPPYHVTAPRLVSEATQTGECSLRLTVAVLLAVLAVLLTAPAQAGSGAPSLIGGGYVPLDCAATVFPSPPWCYRGGSHRVVRRVLRRGRPCDCKPLGSLHVLRARLAEGGIAASLS
jgi:hypothetical protein